MFPCDNAMEFAWIVAVAITVAGFLAFVAGYIEGRFAARRERNGEDEHSTHGGI